MTTNRFTLAIATIFLLSHALMASAQQSVLAETTTRPAAPDNLSTLRRFDARTSPDIQVRLAQSAAPGVGADATIYVLGKTGYTKFRDGTNGFTCLVERQRDDTIEPECFDREGTATTLKARLFVEEERAKGKSETQITAEVDAAYKSGRFIAPRKPGLVYMLSPYNYVLDPYSGHVIHFPGHLMFYAPYATSKDIGAGPGAPFLLNPDRPDALMIVVPAPHADH
jgi:hypothetical protein